MPFGNLAHNNIRLYYNFDKHMSSDKKVIISHFYMVLSGNFSDIHIRMHTDTKDVFIALFMAIGKCFLCHR